MIERFKCLIGLHDWKVGFVPDITFLRVCKHCNKMQTRNYNSDWGCFYWNTVS